MAFYVLFLPVDLSLFLSAGMESKVFTKRGSH